jgi:hypothetical protein
MRKDVGLVLVIQSRKVPGYGKRQPHAKERARPMPGMTTASQLESYFEKDFNPSPTSQVAETMRQLLPLHPELSFDDLRELARREAKKTAQTACKK